MNEDRNKEFKEQPGELKKTLEQTPPEPKAPPTDEEVRTLLEKLSEKKEQQQIEEAAAQER